MSREVDGVSLSVRFLTPAELRQFAKVLRKRQAFFDRVHWRMQRRKWWTLDPTYQWLAQVRNGIAGMLDEVERAIEAQKPKPPHPDDDGFPY